LLTIFSSIEQQGIRIKVPDGQSTIEVFWKTVQADQRNGNRLGPLQHEVDKNFFVQDPALDLRFCKGRLLALTKEGHICLAPAESSIGDSLVVWVGGKVPYILRADGGNYAFVGEWFRPASPQNGMFLLTLILSYVHGGMDRDIGGVQGVEPGDLEEFCII
jgi:hypothetical protein